MEKLNQIRIGSYLSLVFAGALSADGGYLAMSLVVGAFILFHLIGKLAIVPPNQTSVGVNLPRHKIVLYAFAVISGPWFGILLALLLVK